MRVKGFMPPRDGLSRETPTGRAVGRNVVWHNFGYPHPTFYVTNMILSILLYFLKIFFIGFCEWIDFELFGIVCCQKGGAIHDGYELFSATL